MGIKLLPSLLETVDQAFRVLGVLAAEERVVDDAFAESVHVGLQVGRKVKVDDVVQIGDVDLEADVFESCHDAVGRAGEH